MTTATETHQPRACPWCSVAVPSDATHCPACGDSLAQRESIDGLAIAGVTTVDPMLRAYASRPLPIPLPAPSGVGPVSNVPGTMTGLGDLAAPYGSSIRPDSPTDPDTVGRPTDAALEAVERMDLEDASG